VRTTADELNESLVSFIKSSLKGKRIAVHIYENEMDETEYLLSDPIHKRKLLNTIEEIKTKERLKSV
jgi:hypothetical protein